MHLIHENAANKWKEFFQKYYQLTWNTCIRLGNFLFFIFFILYKDYRKIHEVDIKKPKEYSRILTNSHTSNDTHGSNHDINDKNISMKHKKNMIM